MRLKESANELLVLIPIYNDWAAVGLLLLDLDRVLIDAGRIADVLLVDDGSTTDPPARWLAEHWRALRRIEMLSLNSCSKLEVSRTTSIRCSSRLR